MPQCDVAGAAVAGQYADAREEARDHARLRNMYFQQVSQAYSIHLSSSLNVQLVAFLSDVAEQHCVLLLEMLQVGHPYC